MYEYMTGGVTVILGKVGDNFGAGMTGGMSFIYDPNNEFENYANPQTIVWQKPETEYWKKELQSPNDTILFLKQTLKLQKIY